MTSSIFALGYHERVENNTPAPAFLKHLRQAAFARVYSAYKNVSIFFGRPPRIYQKYCCLDILRYRAEAHPYHNQHDDPRQYSSWDIYDKFDYMADTRWSASCAVIKEEILDLYREQNRDEKFRRAQSVRKFNSYPTYKHRLTTNSAMQADAEALWLQLPSHFRLEGDRTSCDRRPIERDSWSALGLITFMSSFCCTWH